MSIVDFNTSIWKDPWFRKLPIKAKVLFVFLWTNDHKNLACLYEIDVETISFYTGLKKSEIEDGFRLLHPKVKYDQKNHIVWVVKYVRHQFLRTGNVSPKIETAIKNNLTQMNGHFFIGEFLEEYKELKIKYEYPIDRVSEGYQYPPGGGKGKGKGKNINGVEKFKPPKIEDVINYFVENGYTEQAGENAYKYYNEANWKDSTGKQVLNWKQKMRGVWFKPENKSQSNCQPKKIVKAGDMSIYEN